MKAQQNKLIGIICILFGLGAFIPFFTHGITKLIDQNEHTLIAKYLIIILLINGGGYFIFSGILFYNGILQPYYCKSTNQYERAKTQLFAILFGMPFWFAMTTTVFMTSDSTFWKILLTLCLVYFGWLFFESFQVIKKNKQQKGHTTSC